MIELVFDEAKIRSDIRFYIKVFKHREDGQKFYTYELKIIEAEDKWAIEKKTNFSSLIDAFLTLYQRIFEWTRKK